MITNFIRDIFLIWIFLFIFVRGVNFFLAAIAATLLVKVVSFVLLYLYIGIVFIWGKFREMIKGDKDVS